MRPVLRCSAILFAGLAAQLLFADDSAKLVRIDHYVGVRSTVPAIEGQTAQIYVREVALAGAALREAVPGDRVILFIHGAGTPAEVSFDVAYQDYSWMEFLARAGFDVFGMDTTGYGRSTRPAPMNDPCNLSREQQTAFVPSLIASPCAPSYPHQLTTIASDWNDINAVVDHIRALRHVERLNLIAWSLGGPRAGGYASQHPDKVRALVLLAPAYNRAGRAEAPEKIPADGPAFNKQSLEDFTSNWDRQVGCPDQYERGAHDAVWSAMLASDQVGATWGTGVRRAPQTTVWGWSTAAVAQMKMPTLMVSGANDKQVPPERVRDLYADLGAPDKVFVDLACSSHNAMWEKNHLLLFSASLEWLTKGTVKGAHEGTLKIGY
ncbi:MAG TPA: alpha/beta fold hydrolase [Bryobacteraceae bacterium]|nr:alpha/beta fold hydrolase [Bryobacteraceae bacterium]